jgi:hypothetical protein
MEICRKVSKLTKWRSLLVVLSLIYVNSCDEIAEQSFNGNFQKIHSVHGLNADDPYLMADIPELIVSMCALPDGNALIAGRNGYIHLIKNIYSNPVPHANPVVVLENIALSEGGLLGMVIHPDFINNRLFYLCAIVWENHLLMNKIELWELFPDQNLAFRHSVILSESVDRLAPKAPILPKEPEWFVRQPDDSTLLLAAEFE